MGAACQLLVDRVPEEAVDKAVLVAADDDQVGRSRLRDGDQLFDRVAALGDEVGLDGTGREKSPCLPQEERWLVWPVGREDVRRSRRERTRPRGDRHPGRDHRAGSRDDGRRSANADDDQLSPQRLREVGRASESAVGARAPVVAGDDCVHALSRTHLAPFETRFMVFRPCVR